MALGMTPYEALRTGTVNAATVLSQSGHSGQGRFDQGQFGQVSPGAQADLLLLEDNPLDDIANVRQRVGVMARGRWLPEAELQSMLVELMASYEPGLLDRLWPLAIVGLAGLLAAQMVRGRRKSGESA